MMADSMASLDIVVALIVGCSAALAFITLYNLTNINIMERVREIATIKVLGFYPLVKPKLDTWKLGLVLKLLLFNGAIGLMYWVLIHLFGMAQVAAEYQELGMVMTAVMLALGNVVFFLLDRILSRFHIRK